MLATPRMPDQSTNAAVSTVASTILSTAEDAFPVTNRRDRTGLLQSPLVRYAAAIMGEHQLTMHDKLALQYVTCRLTAPCRLGRDLAGGHRAQTQRMLAEQLRRPHPDRP